MEYKNKTKRKEKSEMKCKPSKRLLGSNSYGLRGRRQGARDTTTSWLAGFGNYIKKRYIILHFNIFSEILEMSERMNGCR